MPRSRAIVVSALVGAAAVAVMTAGAAFAQGDGGFGGGGFGRHHRDGGFFMFLPMIVLIGVVALAIVLWRGRRPAAASVAAPPAVSPTHNAQAILADRLARGEISPDDYRASVAVLREPPPPPLG